MGTKHVFDNETRKSGLFPCYRLKINDFVSRYNLNLKIDIFTPLQQIPCYCKRRLGTLRLISWWRVTNGQIQCSPVLTIRRIKSPSHVRVQVPTLSLLSAFRDLQSCCSGSAATGECAPPEEWQAAAGSWQCRCWR